MTAALLAVFLPLALPAPAAARVRHGNKVAKKRHHHRAKTATTARAPKASRARRARIYQDIAGKIVLETRDHPAVYGPFPNVELQDYPRPPCEPVDAVVEVRLHEPDANSEGENEGEGSDNRSADLAAQSRVSASLSRLAERVGSFFRPKSKAAVVKPQDVDLSELVSQAFEIPVEGVDAQRLKDSFLSSRGRHRQHLAIDIGAPRGTPVVATTDGEIVRVNRERRGGNSIYQKDSSGQYLLFYCHLSRYAEDLAVGQKVKKGEVIGYVGSTGHVIGGPHLHFSITRLPDDAGSFKRGLAINPYLLFLAEVP
jgi:murein DD-endopeptidase MepM/ murein hydrolase activator NlpD